MQWASATLGPGKAAWKILIMTVAIQVGPSEEGKNDGPPQTGGVKGMTVGENVNSGTPSWSPALSRLPLLGPHSKPLSQPSGNCCDVLKDNTSREQRQTCRHLRTTVSLKGVQRAQRIGVLGFLSSVARKFHLISCFISLPLNQWNFPSLSFSQTKVANVEGEIANAVNSSCLGLMAVTVQGSLGRTVCDSVT